MNNNIDKNYYIFNEHDNIILKKIKINKFTLKIVIII